MVIRPLIHSVLQPSWGLILKRKVILIFPYYNNCYNSPKTKSYVKATATEINFMTCDCESPQMTLHPELIQQPVLIEGFQRLADLYWHIADKHGCNRSIFLIIVKISNCHIQIWDDYKVSVRKRCYLVILLYTVANRDPELASEWCTQCKKDYTNCLNRPTWFSKTVFK